jgi:hypothetical protein
LKGKRHVISLQPAEWVSLVTVFTCMSMDTSFLHHFYFQYIYTQSVRTRGIQKYMLMFQYLKTL